MHSAGADNGSKVELIILIIRTGYTQDRLACTICQFWLFAGQWKSTADQWKLLYIFGSKVAVCVGDEFD